MTTSRPAAPPKYGARSAVRLRLVPLSRITLDPPAAAVEAMPTRFADLKPVPELVAAVTALRPPLVTEDSKPGWYRVVGNGQVVEWLRHIYFFGNDADRPTLVLVVPAQLATSTAFDVASRFLVPLIFDELTYRAGRRARRELKVAGLGALLPRATTNECLRPLLSR